MLPAEMIQPNPSPRAPERAAPQPVPWVRDFDPAMETLGFTLSAEDADAAIRLRDLPDGTGCRVELGDRTLVVLMGVSADEIGPGALELIKES